MGVTKWIRFGRKNLMNFGGRVLGTYLRTAEEVKFIHGKAFERIMECNLKINASFIFTYFNR